MPLKLKDKNGNIMDYRQNNHGIILTKGKRELHLLCRSVNECKRAKEAIAKNSFNKLFTKARKVRVLGSNVAYLKF